MNARYFEDVGMGDALPPLVKGPLTSVHLMRWSAAIEAWHKIHYDQRFATTHDGLPDLLVNGSLKQEYVQQMLADWAGPDGWVWKARLQFRAMNRVGETLSVWGRVRALRRTSGFGLVDIELGITNDAGTESTPGMAVIALPFRDGPALPCPFTPPAGIEA